MGDRVVIVGAGHAGGRTALNLRGAGFTGEITLIGEEPTPPYERPALSKGILLGTEGLEQSLMRVQEEWAGFDVALRLSSRIAAVKPGERVVETAAGESLPFDHLVVATGGRPCRLGGPGGGDPRVVTLRTIEDSLALRRQLSGMRHLVVIGGGVIGLEAAAAARQLGVAVTLIEAGPRLMARIGPPALSDWLLARHRAAGIDIRLGARLTGIATDADLTIHGLDAAGQAFALTADLVLAAIGIEPATETLGAAGIALRNGVPVDQYCRVPGLPIYAAGDIANTYNPLFGREIRQETWRNAENQSRAVAEFICGRDQPYAEIPWMWTDQFGHNIQVVGAWRDGMDVAIRGEFGTSGSACVFLEDGLVAGGVLIDAGRDRRFLESMVTDRKPRDPRELADPGTPLRKLV
jgi:3-phenylpropionate/trans-cinnamate dioxygenase ferredoxin reductase subunit